MTRTIWKFPLPPGDEVVLRLPQGATLLTVQSQSPAPAPMLWADVEPSAPVEERRIVCRGTGHPFKGNEGRYLGTVQLLGGSLVFHYFEGLSEGKGIG